MTDKIIKQFEVDHPFIKWFKGLLGWKVKDPTPFDDDKYLDVKKAPEPDQIIWANLHRSSRSIGPKAITTSIFVLLGLIIAVSTLFIG